VEAEVIAKAQNATARTAGKTRIGVWKGKHDHARLALGVRSTTAM
jgi:hypothetical protein